MNDTLKVIRSRYSCRAYGEREVAAEDLKVLAEAAVTAPSAMNRQGWRVVVVSDRELIREMDEEGMRVLETADKAAFERMNSRGGKLFYNAPAMILVLTDASKDAMDCGIVTQTIALAAQSMGIANVICGMAYIPLSGEKGAEFKSRLRFPEGFDFGMAVLLGYEEASGTPHTPDLEKILYV